MSEPVLPTEDERITSIRALLRAPLEQTAPSNQALGWRTDCDYVLTELDDKLRSLDECIPFLRAHAKSCESCGGAGEIVRGPSDEEATSEPCANCKPIWDLIKRIEPPKPRSVSLATEEEEEDDILF